MSFIRAGKVFTNPGEVLSWPFCCGQPADAAVLRHLEFQFVVRVSESE